MPWQRYVADVACELDERGIPAYREVGITVPRQSGKTTLVLSFQLDRCLFWGRPQRSVFTAQTGKDARDKWIDEIFPLIRGSAINRFVRQIVEGNGNEAIRWKTKSLIRLLSTSTSSGHSKTIDQAVLDEIWADIDDRREQGLRPAMVTRQDAQILWCSTAGTENSPVYNHKVRVGRTAALEDSGRGVAYFEWSAPDDWDPNDLDSYFTFMPALCPDPPCRCSPDWKHTQTLEIIQVERAAMKPMEFLRAYGNRPSKTEDLILPLELWQRACEPNATPSKPYRFAIDIAEDRSSAAIVVFGKNNAFELVDHRAGTGWLVDRAIEVADAYNAPVALDAGGPAAGLASKILNVQEIPRTDVAKACGVIFDAIVDAKVTFRTDEAFDKAIEGVAKAQRGDTWIWSRKQSTSDITPLMAATIALACPLEDDDGPVFSWL